MLFARRVPPLRAVVWTLAAVITACDAHHALVSSAQRPLTAVVRDPGGRNFALDHLVRLRTSSPNRAQIGPSERFLVRTVSDQGQHPGLLAYDLFQPATLPMFIPGIELTDMKFLSASRILAFESHSGHTVLADLDIGHTAEARCRAMPVPTSNGLLCIDEAGHFVLLDPETLATTWLLESPVVPTTSKNLNLVSDTSGLVIATDEEYPETFVLDPQKRVLRLQDDTSAPPVASRSGRYLGYVKTLSDELLNDRKWEIRVVETATGVQVFSSVEDFVLEAGAAPPIVFGHDDGVMAYSISPSVITLVALPSGKKKRIRTGLAVANTIGYKFYTEKLAFTDDQSFVCGHPASTLAHESACENIVYADVRKRSPVHGLPHCVIDGDTAFLLPHESEIVQTGRTLETPLCNEVLSPNHGILALVSARASVEDQVQIYRERELNLVDVQTKQVLLRLPFEAGIGRDSITYSPKGRWLQVVVDDNTKILDVVGLHEVLTFRDWPDSFSADENIGLFFAKGATRITRLADGATRAFPEEVGSLCIRNGKSLASSACGTKN